MKLPCCIIKDLLPLFIENIDSKESHNLIASHLEDCVECRLETENLRKNTVDKISAKENISAFKAVQQQLNRKKSTIIIAFFLMGIILIMFSSWFGGARGVQEIKGTIVLFNPITVVSILAVIVSLFLKKEKTGIIIRVFAFSGIVFMEVFYYFTWYLQTISPNFSFLKSFNMAYPEFYLGLIISCIPLIISILSLLKKVKKAEL